MKRANGKKPPIIAALRRSPQLCVPEIGEMSHVQEDSAARIADVSPRNNFAAMQQRQGLSAKPRQLQIGLLVLTLVMVLAAIWSVSCAGVFWLFRNELQNKG